MSLKQQKQRTIGGNNNDCNSHESFNIIGIGKALRIVRQQFEQAAVSSIRFNFQFDFFVQMKRIASHFI